MGWNFDAKKEIENIVEWIKKYFEENGPKAKAIIGISGGKDSSIAAALLVKALGPDRVLGVKMPQGIQKDIDDANAIISYLEIPSIEINIGGVCDSFYDALIDSRIDLNSRITSNLPARMRMSALYAVAAAVGGRVVNTCNRSEDYVGYSTKFGDAAGDFGFLVGFTVREILAIGDELKLPSHLVHKEPADGLSNKTDEDNLGFTYAELDSYLLEGKIPATEVLYKIETRHERNLHKLLPMSIYIKRRRM